MPDYCAEAQLYELALTNYARHEVEPRTQIVNLTTSCKAILSHADEAEQKIPKSENNKKARYVVIHFSK